MNARSGRKERNMDKSDNPVPAALNTAGGRFSSILSQLRRSHGYSQRKVAADLNISQALLSHYENGAREPGIPFICRACDYYGISADYLLGRSENQNDAARTISELIRIAESIKALNNEAQTALEYLAAAARGEID